MLQIQVQNFLESRTQHVPHFQVCSRVHCCVVVEGAREERSSNVGGGRAGLMLIGHRAILLVSVMRASWFVACVDVAVEWGGMHVGMGVHHCGSLGFVLAPAIQLDVMDGWRGDQRGIG
jgi:hypothetical protein